MNKQPPQYKTPFFEVFHVFKPKIALRFALSAGLRFESFVPIEKLKQNWLFTHL